MATTIESEMMSQCCGAEGKFDVEKMKAFMQRFGKMEFTDDQIAKMKELCREQGDICDEMVKFMRGCGCSC
jgi:hypothetical protein